MRWLVTISVVALAGCGIATVVNRTQYGGTIELNGDRQKAMEIANGHMSGHCGANNYTVVSEGYQPSEAPRNPNAGPPPTIWTIHYQCNGMVGPTPGAPAAYPQDPNAPQPYPQDPTAPQPYPADPNAPYVSQPYSDPNAPPPPPPQNGPY